MTDVMTKPLPLLPRFDFVVLDKPIAFEYQRVLEEVHVSQARAVEQMVTLCNGERELRYWPDHRVEVRACGTFIGDVRTIFKDRHVYVVQEYRRA